MLCFKCLAFNRRMRNLILGSGLKDGTQEQIRASRQGVAWEGRRRRNSEKQNTEPFKDFHFVINCFF